MTKSVLTGGGMAGPAILAASMRRQAPLCMPEATPASSFFAGLPMGRAA